ncbi:hypothetical protein A5782_24440 [Mycobacterium sp. 852002-40037_SCH5390672]|nr:hypothetical protein A5782_24440 [Mycobacterium sp. 852002-40037_SCH5390672]
MIAYRPTRLVLDIYQVNYYHHKIADNTRLCGGNCEKGSQCATVMVFVGQRRCKGVVPLPETSVVRC